MSVHLASAIDRGDAPRLGATWMSVVIMVVFGLLMLFVMEAMVWGKRAKLWAVSRSGFLFLFSNLSDLYETMPQQ